MLLVSVLPISRQEQNGTMIRFAERWAVERFVGVPERRSSSGPVHDVLMVMCWKYFGAIVLKWLC